MSREIKFRVWDKVDYMSSPFTLQDLQLKKVEFTSDCPVMQFTGLKDKNGKEVYEGDILQSIATKIKYEVVFSSKGAFSGEAIGTSHFSPGMWKTTAEIIGNIHQNPELL